MLPYVIALCRSGGKSGFPGAGADKCRTETEWPASHMERKSGHKHMQHTGNRYVPDRIIKYRRILPSGDVLQLNRKMSIFKYHQNGTIIPGADNMDT